MTVEMGYGTYGQPDVRTYGCVGSKVVIGKYCSIADDVTILIGGEHVISRVSTYPFDVLIDKIKPCLADGKSDVVIGNDVWIGTKGLILSGVTVGDGAVVGAGSVVTKDVEPYAVVAGNPARLIRYRFDAETRKKLLELQW